MLFCNIHGEIPSALVCTVLEETTWDAGSRASPRIPGQRHQPPKLPVMSCSYCWVVMGLGQNFDPGRVSNLWFGFGLGKFSLKMSNFKIFFHSGQKNYLRVGSKITQVKGRSASYLLRVKSKLGSGHGLSLLLGGTHLSPLGSDQLWHPTKGQWSKIKLSASTQSVLPTWPLKLDSSYIHKKFFLLTF